MPNNSPALAVTPLLQLFREFNEHDTADSQKVLVINETMARRLWPDRDPLGQIALNGRQEWQVVGVVGDVRHGAIEQQGGMEMYFPMAQNAIGIRWTWW